MIAAPIAAAAFLRGWPRLNGWILHRLPIGFSAAMAGQIALGALATGLALYGIGAIFVPLWLPFLGGIIRDFSEWLACHNFPAQAMAWFAGVAVHLVCS